MCNSQPSSPTYDTRIAVVGTPLMVVFWWLSQGLQSASQMALKIARDFGPVSTKQLQSADVLVIVNPESAGR